MSETDIIKKAIVLIKNGNSRGTGYLIANDLVATCAHVVENKNGEQVDIYIGAKLVSAKVEALDVDDDCALLRLPRALDMAPLPLAEVDFKRGDEWEAYGYPAITNEAGHWLVGTVQDTRDKDLGGREAVVLYAREIGAADGAHPQGFSGSPVLINGKVVGHLKQIIPNPSDFSAPRAMLGTLYACPLEVIRKLLPPQERGVQVNIGDEPDPECSVSGFLLSASPWRHAHIGMLWGLDRGAFVGLVADDNIRRTYITLTKTEEKLRQAMRLTTCYLPERKWETLKFKDTARFKLTGDTMALGVLVEIGVDDCSPNHINELNRWCYERARQFPNDAVIICVVGGSLRQRLSSIVGWQMSDRILRDRLLLRQPTYYGDAWTSSVRKQLGTNGSNAELLREIRLDRLIERRFLSKNLRPEAPAARRYLRKININDLVAAFLRRYQQLRLGDPRNGLINDWIATLSRIGGARVCAVSKVVSGIDSAAEIFSDQRQQNLATLKLAVSAGIKASFSAPEIARLKLDTPILWWLMATQLPSLEQLSALLQLDVENRAVFGLCTPEERAQILQDGHLLQKINSCRLGTVFFN